MNDNPVIAQRGPYRLDMGPGADRRWCGCTSSGAGTRRDGTRRDGTRRDGTRRDGTRRGL